MNMIEEFEREQIAKLTEGKEIPDFAPGDTVQVNVRITEGARERIQVFEGVCIARTNRGAGSSFTVRKISHGEGVERIFPLYSPSLESIKVVRRGRVRRAKLYYLRGRRGKKARIAERQEYRKSIETEEPVEAAAEPETPEPEAKKKAAKKKAPEKAAKSDQDDKDEKSKKAKKGKSAKKDKDAGAGE